jgi:hypothetical protein
MSKPIYQKITQPISRYRYYTFTKFDDGTAMLSIDATGMTTIIHFGEGDVEKFGEDFNAG